jgi:hypothetical protein
MIREHWYRIAGIHCQDDGAIAAVWMAHDKDADTLHLYDACLFRREVLAVVAEGLNARGRWIPVAWHVGAKEIADNLLDRGVNTLPEPVESSQAAIEAVSLEVWGRMRSHRFRVDKRLGEWKEEYRTFYRQDSKVPSDTHPLMAATRHAVAALAYARRQSASRGGSKNFPKVAII